LPVIFERFAKMIFCVHALFTSARGVFNARCYDDPL